MKLLYLLDTNILSALIRDPRGALRDRIAEVGERSVCTSVIVAAELRFGVLKSGSVRLGVHADLVLSTLEVLPFEPPADRHYADIRAHLTRAGTPIGPNDLLIAAQSRSTNLTLVTANVREFARVPDLRLENWLTD